MTNSMRRAIEAIAIKLNTFVCGVIAWRSSHFSTRDATNLINMQITALPSDGRLFSDDSSVSNANVSR